MCNINLHGSFITLKLKITKSVLNHMAYFKRSTDFKLTALIGDKNHPLTNTHISRHAHWRMVHSEIKHGCSGTRRGRWSTFELFGNIVLPNETGKFKLKTSEIRKIPTFLQF